MFDNERKGYYLVASHIRGVQSWMRHVVTLWADRMVTHDQSKYSSPELPLIQQKARLDSIPLNTPEYHEALGQIKGAVQAHYECNTHHPEHYPGGVLDMSLLDLLEMICDWRVAAEMNGTDLTESFDKCVERFKIPDDLRRVLFNSYVEFGWIAKSDND